MDTKNKVSMKADNNSGADNCYIVTITPPYGNMVTVTAWTNEQGNGLWINGKQIEGTSQFYTATLPPPCAATLRSTQPSTATLPMSMGCTG
jgi:hypothetical protein